MGSKNSVCEESNKTCLKKYKPNEVNGQHKENEHTLHKKRRPQKSALRCCLQDFVSSSNTTTPEFEMVPKVKKSKITSNSSTTSTQSNCKILSNKISIQKLRQSERGSHLAAFFRLFGKFFLCKFIIVVYLVSFVSVFFGNSIIMHQVRWIIQVEITVRFFLSGLA